MCPRGYQLDESGTFCVDFNECAEDRRCEDGGCRNSLLIEQLQRRCRGLIVRPLAELGIAEAEREALAFALLAWWHVRGHRGNAPSVTGARKAAVLGLCARPQASAWPM